MCEPEQSVGRQVEDDPLAQEQNWVAVAVRPVTSVDPSLVAAVCIAALFSAVARDCAPYWTPARAALVTSIQMYINRPKSAAPSKRMTKIGVTRASSMVASPQSSLTSLPSRRLLRSREFVVSMVFLLYSDRVTNLSGVDELMPA